MGFNSGFKGLMDGYEQYKDSSVFTAKQELNFIRFFLHGTTTPTNLGSPKCRGFTITLCQTRHIQ